MTTGPVSPRRCSVWGSLGYTLQLKVLVAEATPGSFRRMVCKCLLQYSIAFLLLVFLFSFIPGCSICSNLIHSKLKVLTPWITKHAGHFMIK